MPAISSISIVIKAITSPFIKGIKGAGSAVTGLVGIIAALGNIIKEVVTGIITIIGEVLRVLAETITKILKLSAIITTVLIGALTALTIKALRAATVFETLQTQFITLLGGAGAAARRFQELKKFAAETPFQLPDIAKASRVLEALTKGALSSGEGLKLVGDAAAIANEPINLLAVHIGRVFQGLQTGRAVGESLARLQELGLLSGEARTQIEDLQKEGIKGQRVWGIVEAALKRNAGAMKLLSETAAGLVSTLKDNVNIAFAELGALLLPIAKFVLKLMIDRAQKLAKAIERNAEAIKTFLKSGFEKIAPVFIQVQKVAKAAFKIITDFFDKQGPEGVDNFLKALEKFLLKAQFVTQNFKEVWILAMDKVAFEFKKWAAIILGILLAPFKIAADAFLLLFGTSLDEVFKDFKAKVMTAIKIMKLLSPAIALQVGIFEKLFEENKEGERAVDAVFKKIQAGAGGAAATITKALAKAFGVTKEKAEELDARIAEMKNRIADFEAKGLVDNANKAKEALDEMVKLIPRAETRIEKFFKKLGTGVDKVKGAFKGIFEGVAADVEKIDKAMDRVREALGIAPIKSKFDQFIDGLIEKAKNELQTIKIPEPTLARKGSQAAARGELGLLNKQDDQLKQQKKTNLILQQIREKIAGQVLADANFGIGGT